MLNESNIPLEEDGIEEEILVDEEVAITKAMWGDVGGNIENQTDLQNALDAKQDSLTEAQLNAVNSGITSEKVTTYDGYADQIASKADQSALNAESTARGEADTALGTRIDNEALARQSVDNGLQTQIDAITSKSDVVDVVANYAALQAYDTSTLGNNDVVKVLDDETHEDALTYYRWSTTTQTWSYIGQEAPYYSKGQMDVKLAEKQDKLTAGANIQIQNGTISATDTKYTNGNGLNLNGTEFSADTDVLATKEDLEGYYTKPETDNLLAPKLEAEVVAELPTTGAEGKLYLTPKAHTTSTATGNPIEATITAQAGQLESFQLDGDTFQQTYTGKNLAYPETGSGVYNGLKATYNPSTHEITVTGTPTTTWSIPFLSFTQAALTLPAGTYTLKQRGTLTNGKIGVNLRHGNTVLTEREVNSSSLETTFTISSDANGGYLFLGSMTTGQAVSGAITVQLEAGSTASDFEPFVGGQSSPSPDYPQQIQTVTGEQTVEVVGRNLFDKNDVVNGIPSASDGTIVSTTSIGRTSGFIRVKSSTSYSHTGHPNGWATIAWYRADESFISRTDNATTTTSPTEAALARVSCASTDLNTCQFEEGQPTTYAPYSKQTLPLDLGNIELCKIGDYQDYIYKDGNDWKVHKELGNATLDSTYYNSRYGTNSYGLTQFLVELGVSDYYDVSGYVNMLSNSFTKQTTSFSNTQVQGFLPALDSNSHKLMAWIRISTTTADTADQFKAWLNTNTPIFYYKLNTATDTTITDTTLIAQLEAIRTASLENGTNTITNTATGTNLAGDMEIGYFEFNPTNRYDKFIWLNLNNNYEQIGG